MSWLVYVTDRAKDGLKRLSSKDLRRIEKTIDEMEVDPFLGDIEKLSGQENVWRRRVGNYRIKYQLYSDKNLVLIYEIERRTSKTY